MDSIEIDEKLARFLFQRKWIRADKTVKPNAFIPKDLRLSVTRHKNIGEDEIWKIGCGVGVKRDKAILGRADLIVLDVRNLSLNVESVVEDDNNNHAEIINWPENKNEIKMKALEIAVLSKYVEVPQTFDIDVNSASVGS